MDIGEAPDLLPERFDAFDKVGQIARPQVIIAIASAIVGRVPRRRIDLRLGDTARRQERMDRVAQRVRGPDPFHLAARLGLAQLCPGWQPNRLATVVDRRSAELEFGVCLSGFDQAGLERFAQIGDRFLEIIGATGGARPGARRGPVTDNLPRHALEPWRQRRRDRHDRPALACLFAARRIEMDQPLLDLGVGIEFENCLRPSVGRQEDHHVEQHVRALGRRRGRVENGSDLFRAIFKVAALRLALHVGDLGCRGQKAFVHSPVDRSAKRFQVATDSRGRHALLGTVADEFADEGGTDAGNGIGVGHASLTAKMIVEPLPCHHRRRVTVRRIEIGDMVGQPSPRDLVDEHRIGWRCGIGIGFPAHIMFG